MIGICMMVGGIAAGVTSRKRGFLLMWTVLLSATLAVYISVMLSPTLVGWLPALRDRRLLVAAMLLIAAATFGGLLLLSARSFATAWDYRLPEIWDQCGAGVCGLGASYLAISYVLFVASIPWLATSAGPASPVDLAAVAQVSAPIVATTCSVVHRLSWQSDRDASRQVVTWLRQGCEDESADFERELEPEAPASVENAT